MMALLLLELSDGSLQIFHQNISWNSENVSAFFMALNQLPERGRASATITA